MIGWLRSWWVTIRYRGEHKALRSIGPFDEADYVEARPPGEQQ